MPKIFPVRIKQYISSNILYSEIVEFNFVSFTVLQTTSEVVRLREKV